MKLKVGSDGDDISLVNGHPTMFKLDFLTVRR